MMPVDALVGTKGLDAMSGKLYDSDLVRGDPDHDHD